MSWNWALRDRFLEAGRLLNYKVECNWRYYKMSVPNGGVWCYLWHPLNKMDNLREEELTAERALDYIRNNQDDFHIELDRDPRYGHSISYLFPEVFDDPSVAVICECILKAQDEEEIRARQFMYELRSEE